MAPVVLLLSCELMLWRMPWRISGPGACFVVAWFIGLEPTTDNIPVMTPQQIVPSGYLLPTYGMLRSITFNFGTIDARVLGLSVAAASFLAPLTLSFFNWSKTPARAWLVLLIIPSVLIGLGWIG